MENLLNQEKVKGISEEAYSRITGGGEEILENFGLAKLIAEVETDELLSGDTVYAYYQSLKIK